MNRPWDLPEVTGIGRLPMHSVNHDERLPLDGRWRFQLLSKPDGAYASLYQLQLLEGRRAERRLVPS